MNQPKRINSNRKTRGPGPKKQRNASKSISRVERMEHPPQINGYEITHSKRLRFTATAASSTAITFADLLDTILVATTAVAGFDLFDIVRIVQVEVWGQAALGTPSSVSVVFTTATGDRSIHTDTSLGVKPAHVSARPSDKSLASFWQVFGAGAAFQLQCPAGSVIDVSLEYRTAETFAPQAAQNALVTATAGDVYYRGLDGLAIAGTNFPPILGVNII